MTESGTGARPAANASGLGPGGRPSPFMTVAEVAELLRTSPKAIYARAARGLLPGAFRDRRRLLVEREVLLESLLKRRATSLGVDPR